MNLLSGTATKTFSLLSIGQRGVGKTVFLAGSYAELHPNGQNQTQQLWFDCQETQMQKNIESILRYVVQTAQYPPATIKVTNFSFSLKRQNRWGTQTLCHFRWWDIPGELCKMQNQDFRNTVTTSHGCCVFIDAYALVHSHAYLKALEDITDQVMAIASLVSLNGLEYAFALILTKCDLLQGDPLSRQQIKLGLQPLTNCLDAVKANYQTFYTHIPIVHTESTSTLKPQGAAAPLLWLVWELSKAHNLGLTNNLLELVTSLLPANFGPQQLADSSLQRLFKPADKPAKFKKSLGLYLLPSIHRSRLVLALAIAAAAGIVISLGVNYGRFLQSEFKNLDVLENVDTVEQRRQFYQAISSAEKLVQQKPERVELRLHLAKLYEFTGQVSKAETVYDQVLAQQKNNFKALVGKAVLCKAQGDIKTAEILFAQAEKVAPSDFKAQVRAATQKTLQRPLNK